MVMAVTFGASWASGGREQTIATIKAESTIRTRPPAPISELSHTGRHVGRRLGAAMRISGTPLSSRGRSMARTVSES